MKANVFLITYGAGHKGWFLRELRKRDDIELLDMKTVFRCYSINESSSF